MKFYFWLLIQRSHLHCELKSSIWPGHQSKLVLKWCTQVITNTPNGISHNTSQCNALSLSLHVFVILCFQRTERAPKDRNVAETDPSKFANMLIEKLERVKEERDKIERVRETLSSVEVKSLVLSYFVTFSFHVFLFFFFLRMYFLLWSYQLFFFLSPQCSLYVS